MRAVTDDVNVEGPQALSVQQGCMCPLQGTRRYGSDESEPIDWIVSPANQSSPGHMTTPGLSEMFAYHATTMANTIKTSLIVFSRKVCEPLLALDPN